MACRGGDDNKAETAHRNPRGSVGGRLARPQTGSGGLGRSWHTRSFAAGWGRGLHVCPRVRGTLDVAFEARGCWTRCSDIARMVRHVQAITGAPGGHSSVNPSVRCQHSRASARRAAEPLVHSSRQNVQQTPWTMFGMPLLAGRGGVESVTRLNGRLACSTLAGCRSDG